MMDEQQAIQQLGKGSREQADMIIRQSVQLIFKEESLRKMTEAAKQDPVGVAAGYITQAMKASLMAADSAGHQIDGRTLLTAGKELAMIIVSVYVQLQITPPDASSQMVEQIVAKATELASQMVKSGQDGAAPGMEQQPMSPQAPAQQGGGLLSQGV